MELTLGFLFSVGIVIALFVGCALLLAVGFGIVTLAAWLWMRISKNEGVQVTGTIITIFLLILLGCVCADLVRDYLADPAQESTIQSENK